VPGIEADQAGDEDCHKSNPVIASIAASQRAILEAGVMSP